jgi:hypothetical protein
MIPAKNHESFKMRKEATMVEKNPRRVKRLGFPPSPKRLLKIE